MSLSKIVLAELSEHAPEEDQILGALGQALEEGAVPYCVLADCSSNGRVRELAIALEPASSKNVQTAVKLLRGQGWIVLSGPAQLLLATREEDSLSLVRAELVLDKSIVDRRHRNDGIWVADARDEIAFLSQKRSVGGLSPNQHERLESLKAELGSNLQKPTGLRSIRAPYAGIDALKHGIFVVILGPDGVGKSTSIQRMRETLGPLFKETRVHHCRPFVLGRLKNSFVLGRPHHKPPRGALLSMVFLSGFFVDCWLGYFRHFRRFLKLPGLVIFDRYFYDVLIDPKRYRYGGPMWFVKLLSRFVPPFDSTILVLDASAEAIFRRKQELPLEELKRQRESYSRFQESRSSAIVVDCDEIKCAAANVLWTVLNELERRSGIRSSQSPAGKVGADKQYAS